MASWSGTTTLVANVTRDPELRYTAGSKAVVSFSVAVSKKYNDKEQTVFIDCVAFEKMAENIAASVRKGDRVVLYGEIDPQSWADKEDPTKTHRKTGLSVLDCGVSLKYNMVEVSRVERTKAEKPAAEPAAGEEPW